MAANEKIGGGILSEGVKIPTNARFATLDELIKTTLPLFLNPIPCKATLRIWFRRAKVRRLQANPLAKKGGGHVYYSVADVEKLFTSRTTIR